MEKKAMVVLVEERRLGRRWCEGLGLLPGDLAIFSRLAKSGKTTFALGYDAERREFPRWIISDIPFGYIWKEIREAVRGRRIFRRRMGEFDIRSRDNWERAVELGQRIAPTSPGVGILYSEPRIVGTGYNYGREYPIRIPGKMVGPVGELP